MEITAYIVAASLCALGAFALRRRGAAAVITSLFLLCQVGLALWAGFNKGATSPSYFTVDALGLILLLCITVVAVPAAVHSGILLEEEQVKPSSRAVYASAFIMLVAALSLGYLSNHVALTWVFTEVTTLSAAMLIYHHRNKRALEGTWKYVFVCAISVSFVFIGILFMSLSLMHAGSLDLGYASLLAHAGEMDPFWMKLGFIFIVVGYTAKLGLFPMFTAGIDAKDTAPAPVGALLSSVLVNLGFVGVYRVYAVVRATPLAFWSRTMLVALAFISLFVATAYMIRVRNFKRMLAYSGIEHMSHVTLGVAAGGIGCYAAILHLVMHTFVKSGLFLHFSQLFRVFGTRMLDEMGGYFDVSPFGALVLLLGFVGITAVPPSGLFVSEFMIFRAMFGAGQYALLALAVLLLTVLIWAFARSVFKIVFIPLERRAAPVETAKPSPWESVTQLALFCLATAIGFFPPASLVELIREAAACIG